MSLSSAFALANRGPLTTIFTPPASCLTETTVVSFPTTALANRTSTFTTTKIFINHFSWGDGNCYPSTIATFDGSTRWGNGYYYSPGICPTGWASACQISTNALGFPTSISSQTSAVMCCPSNWECVGGTTTLTAHGCSTALLAGETLTSVWLPPQPTPSITMPLPDVRDLTTWTVPKNTSAVCDGIPVLWQNTDIQILALLGITPTSSSQTSSPTGSQSSNTSPTSTGATSEIPASSGSSLSSGAKAAIGVTIPLVFIALIAGIFFFFRRRRNSQQPHIHHELPTSAENDSGNWTPMSFLKHGLKYKASELDSSRIFEADGGHQIVEIGEGRGAVFELADTSSINEGTKDVKNINRSSDGRNEELQTTKRIKRRPVGQEVLLPVQGQSIGSEIDIDPIRESAPPSYTI
ncbi:hypothetical protein EG329_011584 [Mollisiaceae sp. DMI_Dod_QoI]|nr:hypothetical protein EG329_011584 [Helotiales sp. DMI_Dod_QoI]